VIGVRCLFVGLAVFWTQLGVAMTCSELFAMAGFEVPVRLRGQSMAPNLKAPDSLWPLIDDVTRVDDLSILFSKASSRLAKDPKLNPHKVILKEAGLNVAAHGVEALAQRPKTQGLLVLGTHPNGGFDGLGIAASLAAVDAKPATIVAKKVVAEIPTMRPLVIEVNTTGTLDAARDNLKIRDQIKAALIEGKTVVIFPSGRIAGVQDGQVSEFPWKKFAVQMASSTNALVSTAWVEPMFGPKFNKSQLRKDTSQAIYAKNLSDQTMNVVFSPPRSVDQNISSMRAQELINELQAMTQKMGEEFRKKSK
jgi:1-acyl-sn-glycerol-3-phosphate acyltransferase